MTFQDVVLAPFRVLVDVFRSIVPDKKADGVRLKVLQARESAQKAFVYFGLIVVFVLLLFSEAGIKFGLDFEHVLLPLIGIVAFYSIIEERPSGTETSSFAMGSIYDELKNYVKGSKRSVTIQIVSYSAETFLAFFNSLNDHEHMLDVSELIIEVLIWDCENAPRELFQTRDGRLDANYVAYARSRIADYPNKIVEYLDSFYDKASDKRNISISLIVKSYPLHPSFKAFIIDRKIVLFGLYQVDDVKGGYKGQQDSVRDWQGKGMVLAKADDGSSTNASIQRWFRNVWNGLSGDELRVNWPRNQVPVHEPAAEPA